MSQFVYYYNPLDPQDVSARALVLSLMSSTDASPQAIGRLINAAALFGIEACQTVSQLEPGAIYARHQQCVTSQREHQTAESFGRSNTDGIALGYRYEDSPVILPDRTSPPTDEVRDYRPTTRPGHRAPHAWINEGRSTLDLFGDGLILMSFDAPAEASESFLRAANSRVVPLTVIPVSQPEIAELYERRLVLVRPDGHVAWRGHGVPPDPERLIDLVRGASTEFGST